MQKSPKDVWSATAGLLTNSSSSAPGILDVVVGNDFVFQRQLLPCLSCKGRNIQFHFHGSKSLMCYFEKMLRCVLAFIFIQTRLGNFSRCVSVGVLLAAG